MTLRATVILILCIFTGMLALLASKSVGAWQEMQGLNRLEADYTLRGYLNDGLINMSLERSVIQVTLNLPDPIAPQFRALADAQRTKSNEAFERLIAEAEKRPDLQSTFVSAVKDSLSLINQLRNQADQALTQPLSARDPAIITAWPREIPSQISYLNSLRNILVPDGVSIPGVINVLTNIVQEGWRVREMGGRDRTIMAIALAKSAPISDSDLAFMQRMHTEALQSERMLDKYLLSPNLPTTIRNDIQALQHGYFKDYLTLREQIKAASAKGQPYPLGFIDYFTKSTEFLNLAENLHIHARHTRSKLIQTMLTQQYWLFLAWLAAFAVVALFVVWLSWFLWVRILARFTNTTHIVNAIAEGQLEHNLATLIAKDEVGQLAKAVETLRQAAQEKRQLEATQAARQKQLEAELDTKLRTLTDNVSQTSHTVSDQLNTIASAASQLSSTTTNLTDQVRKSAENTRQAVDKAKNNQAIVQALTTATNKISDAVKMISDIADQTNLLALNASIEAARAGDSGRGFAVVADEVKKLSKTTVAATQEVSSQIHLIRDAAEGTVAALSDVQSALENIDSSLATMSHAMTQQQTATEDISNSLTEASKGTQCVAQQISSLRQ